MSRQRRPAILTVSPLCLLLLLIGGGCSTDSAASNTYRREWNSDDIGPLDMRLALTESTLDTRNLFSSAVMISVSLDSGDWRTCSGVLIDPSLALTAAHCVCGIPKTDPRAGKNEPPLRSQTSGIVMDGSNCISVATVTTVTYKQPNKTNSHREDHVGKVRPHQDFRIVLDREGRVLVNEADLAVIVLDEALPGKAHPPALLAKSAVRVGDAVTLVGFGLDGYPRGNSEERRSGKNSVAALEASGKTFLVGQGGSHALGGDSGGPCFRDGLLVGIATTTAIPPVGYSEFTSTHFYRDWMTAQINMARKARPTAASGAP
jgi:hypothetical protein